MEECEICGSEDARYLVRIEGARLRTCAACASGGEILERQKAPMRQETPQPQVRKGKPELDVVSDFGERIIAARRRMHIERKVLAEMISEKESFLDRVERGKSAPSEALARKLEKALGIRLLEVDSGDEHAPVPKAGGKGITLGDIVMVKKKGKVKRSNW